MPARSVGSGTVSFGLVAIPVRCYVATHSEAPSFNLLHQPCGSRIKQQVFCPRCERTVATVQATPAPAARRRVATAGRAPAKKTQ